jgi:hypothetical protein
MALPPTLELVNVVRTFIEEVCRRLLHDALVSSQVAVAAHELIENAVKFSKHGAPELTLEIDADERGRLINISTSNRADPTDVETVRALLEELAAIQDADAYYRELMMRAAVRTDGESGLGLGRIMAESQMSITGSIDIDRVTICASLVERKD